MISTFEQFLDEERIKYNINGIIMGFRIQNKCHTLSTTGSSMTTIPTNKHMHYRIGGQSIPVLTTLFLILVDKGHLQLNETVSTFLPRVPNSKLITLRMLCNMTAGLPDLIDNPVISEEMDTQVFKQWTDNELLNVVYKSIPLYPPGQSFYFAVHTNMLLLGTCMKIRMSNPIKYLLQKYIFTPLKLKNTQFKRSQLIQEPVFHSFVNVRTPYYEDSTYWNGSWGSYATMMNSNSHDINILAQNIGSGSLISDNLYQIQLENPFGPANEYYGMGIAVGGFGLDYLKSQTHPYSILWSNQNYLGYLGISAYIPKYRLSINIETNKFDINNISFEANQILSDLFATFTFKQIIHLSCQPNNIDFK